MQITATPRYHNYYSCKGCIGADGNDNEWCDPKSDRYAPAFCPACGDAECEPYYSESADEPIEEDVPIRS